MRGEKPVNEPDGPLGLALSEKENNQLMRSHPFLYREKGGLKFVHFCQHLVVICSYATKLRHGRTLARVRLIA